MPSTINAVSGKLLAAPDSFRMGRADGQGKRLADGFDRHRRFHRLVGDLDPADSVPVIESNLGTSMNRALLPRDFYYNAPLAAHNEVGKEDPWNSTAFAFLTLRHGKSVVRAQDQSIGAVVDSELGLAVQAPDGGPVDHPAVALRRNAVPVERGKERGFGVGLADPELRVISAEPVRVGRS